MKATQLRVGIVGGGRIAQAAELPALAARPDVRMCGIVTGRPESAARNIARWPIDRAFASVEEMIAESRLDALMVLTPAWSHVSFVETGLHAGLDVFCEKPLATSLDDARRLAELADQAARLLMVGFCRRYAESYVRAKEEFADARPLFAVAQKNRAGSEYRATLENAIHMIDLLRWFCGEPVTVSAQASASDPYAEDGTAALIRFDTGSVGVLMAARVAGEWDERLDLYGGGTSVRVVAPDSTRISRDREARLVELQPRAGGSAPVLVTNGFGPEVDHFIECVRERRRPLTDGWESVRTQALAEEILRVAGLPTTDAPGTPRATPAGNPRDLEAEA
jgi:virulence factor